MYYDFNRLEKEMQAHWRRHQVHKVKEEVGKPKRYILDMFPYPSGSGLHVGHLLGYFASDALAIFSRLQGYNVLHPMGFDAFGLPAEQYAMDTGQHPAITTAANERAYRKVFERAGITYDWSRSFSTTDAGYYKWTQWIFLLLFESWYDDEEGKAVPISRLTERLAREGNANIRVMGSEPPLVTAEEWRGLSVAEQQKLLAHYRLAYLAETMVNWCPALGTVLANDEVKDGFSERGGHPVVKKQMYQWNLRLLPYADRLLEGLDGLDWSDAVKEMQRNWIGKSVGCLIHFGSENPKLPRIDIFTTRPDTLFGVSYLALAPEHPAVDGILDGLQEEGKASLVSGEECPYAMVRDYIEGARNGSERERMQESREPSGVFTHCYALHPFTKKRIPIWIADYVLPQYGTGAIMGVPAHDVRDYAFAKRFELPMVRVIEPPMDWDVACGVPYEGKEGRLMNAAFLNGLSRVAAEKEVMRRLRAAQAGEAHISYKLRNPVFSRQRYWGEPFPIYYKEGMAYGLSAEDLPLELPRIDSYQSGEGGEPPLARAIGWETREGHRLEYNTMPAWAGSSWYFLRYMDPHNGADFASRAAMEYWGAVDYYVGGAEHTTGHLLYARFFTKVLYDLGYLPFEEPFERLINQGMLQGRSAFVYRIKGRNEFVSYGRRGEYETVRMHVDVGLVKGRELDLEAFRGWRPDLADATFVLEKGVYICGEEVEKMSKSKYNVVDPHEIMDVYGADALRLHILFLGPITQSKPWNSRGIQGVVRFLKKTWGLFYDASQGWRVVDGVGSADAHRALHEAIVQVRQDLERCAFHTCISSLMILVNRLTALDCHEKEILVRMLPLLAPFAPHMAEGLWQSLGDTTTIFTAAFPRHDPAYLTRTHITYPIAINGKRRAALEVGADMPQETIVEKALAVPAIVKWLDGKRPQRTIVVPGRMINLVV